MSNGTTDYLRQRVQEIAAAGVKTWSEDGRATMFSLPELIAAFKEVQRNEQQSGFYPLELVDDV